MTSPATVTFLRDVDHGGDAGQLGSIAQRFVEFVGAAHTSLEVAIYDFRLSDRTTASAVVGALVKAAADGVAVRVAYDAGKPSTADAGTGDTAALTFAALGADPAPPGTPEWVTSHFDHTAVQTAAIDPGSQIMHSKYMLRDATTDAAAVWTGSTNFTDDAWTRQENNIIVLADPAMARAYRQDFEQLWSSRKVTGTGAGGAGTDTPGGHQLGWDFCPADGAAINTALATRVGHARTRLVVASMVLTSHEVLAALAEAVTRGVPVRGIYDRGQMDPIVREWQKSTNPATTRTLQAWQAVSTHLVAKPSTPYSPDGPHDFMHLKVLLADATVVTGSYNFSANAERNAENQLHYDDPDIVTAYAAYLDAVIAAYTRP